MIGTDPLVFFAVCDLSGHVRGKAVPEAEIISRMTKGVGLTHSNIMMSAFGPIYATPFGTEGDLMAVPDPSAKVEVPFDDGSAERFYLSDIQTTEGEPWECCPRAFLQRGLDSLRRESGLTLLAAFEHEFVYTGVEERPGDTYALDMFRRQGRFGESLMAAIRLAGCAPDSFLPEYGPRQFEVTVGPRPGLRAADEAVMVRELARGIAWRLGHRAIFAPILKPDGIGNGAHIHFSLVDEDDRPAMPDPAAPFGLSEAGRHFVAGILHHMPALSAITAPSVASYYRLQPNRWAPTWANLGYRDRGAALRVCPTFRPADEEEAGRQFNVEFRVADATACPYMALGAIVHAGLDGLRRKLDLPAAPASGFWELSEAERQATGVRVLPRTLGAALDALEATEPANDWLGPQLLACYLQLKRSEIAALEGLSDVEICARYAEAY